MCRNIRCDVFFCVYRFMGWKLNRTWNDQFEKVGRQDRCFNSSGTKLSFCAFHQKWIFQKRKVHLLPATVSSVPGSLFLAAASVDINCWWLQQSSFIWNYYASGPLDECTQLTQLQWRSILKHSTVRLHFVWMNINDRQASIVAYRLLTPEH